MLQTLHQHMARNLPIYAMNRGTVGFLLNECREDNLYDGKNYLKKNIILKGCG